VTDDSSTTDVVITVVHGTFARAATWTQPESAFQLELLRHLRVRTVFRRFEWSGDNSHQARIDAGVALARHLDEIDRECSGCPQAVIAHSHGGNVACYALRHLGRTVTLPAIVTLGTPFITCRRRAIGEREQILITVLLDAIAVLLAVFTSFAPCLVYAGMYGVGSLDTRGYLILLSLILVAPLALLFMFLLTKAHGRVYAWLLRKQEAIDDSLDLGRLGPTLLLAITIAQDEAGFLLSWLQRAANGPATLYRWAARLMFSLWFTENTYGSAGKPGSVPDRWLLVLASALMIPMGVFVAIVFPLMVIEAGPESLPLRLPILLIAVGSAVAVGSFLLVGLLHVLMIWVPVVVRAHRLGFGGESLFHNYLANITAVEDPSLAFRTDSSCVTHLKVPEAVFAQQRRPLRLRHSYLHQSEHIARVIATWLNGTLRPTAESMAPLVPTRGTINTPWHPTTLPGTRRRQGLENGSFFRSGDGVSRLLLDWPATPNAASFQQGTWFLRATNLARKKLTCAWNRLRDEAAQPGPDVQFVDPRVLDRGELPWRTLLITLFGFIASVIYEMAVVDEIRLVDLEIVQLGAATRVAQWMFSDLATMVAVTAAFWTRLSVNLKSLGVILTCYGLASCAGDIGYLVRDALSDSRLGDWERAFTFVTFPAAKLAIQVLGICIGLDVVGVARLGVSGRLSVYVFFTSLLCEWLGYNYENAYVDRAMAWPVALLLALAWFLKFRYAPILLSDLVFKFIVAFLLVGYAGRLFDAQRPTTGLTLGVGWCLVKGSVLASLWAFVVLALHRAPLELNPRRGVPPSDSSGNETSR